MNLREAIEELGKHGLEPACEGGRVTFEAAATVRLGEALRDLRRTRARHLDLLADGIGRADLSPLAPHFRPRELRRARKSVLGRVAWLADKIDKCRREGKQPMLMLSELYALTFACDLIYALLQVAEVDLAEYKAAKVRTEGEG